MSIDLTELRAEVRKLREEGRGNPRVHPNGFTQLDLSEVEEDWHASHKRGHSGAARRLHIWNPPGIELPHQGTVNEIHDHVFDMRSTVVRGVLTQRLYGFVIGRQYRFGPRPVKVKMWKAVYAKSGDSRLEDTGLIGDAELWDSFPIFPDTSYEQPAFTFHDSDPGENCVVTVMEKVAIHDGDAHVLVPADIEPDNSFDRANAAPVELLWEAIERSLA